jgi:hypothetical protein
VPILGHASPRRVWIFAKRVAPCKKIKIPGTSIARNQYRDAANVAASINLASMASTYDKGWRLRSGSAWVTVAF